MEGANRSCRARYINQWINGSYPPYSGTSMNWLVYGRFRPVLLKNSLIYEFPSNGRFLIV